MRRMVLCATLGTALVGWACGEARAQHTQETARWWTAQIDKPDLMLAPLQKQYSNKEYVDGKYDHYVEDPTTGIYYIAMTQQEYRKHFDRRWGNLPKQERDFLWRRRVKDSDEMKWLVRYYIGKFGPRDAPNIPPAPPPADREPPDAGRPLPEDVLKKEHERLLKRMDALMTSWLANRRAHKNTFRQDEADFKFVLSKAIKSQGTPGGLKVVDEWLTALDEFNKAEPHYPRRYTGGKDKWGRPEWKDIRGEAAEINRAYGAKLKKTP